MSLNEPVAAVMQLFSFLAQSQPSLWGGILVIVLAALATVAICVRCRVDVVINKNVNNSGHD